MTPKQGTMTATVTVAIAIAAVVGQAGLPTGDDSEPTTAVTDLRGLLELWGVDRSHFDGLTDGVPWQEGEDELLLKVLYRLERIGIAQFEDWSKGDPEPEKLGADPDSSRGEVFHVRGRVSLVEVHRPVAEVRERFELDEYYQCRFRLGEEAQEAIVFARTIPDAWGRGEPMNERAGALAAFLKMAGDGQTGPLPVFVASRIAWYPNTLLGDLGMDVGLLDDLGPDPSEFQADTTGESGSGIGVRELRFTGRDTEPFYQMLAAVGRADPNRLLGEARKELKATGQEHFSVVPLFNEPYAQKGRLVLLSGTARRVLPVQVTSPDLARRFGFDRYFEIALFTEDSQSNPLIFCVRELPEGMPTGEGPRYGEYLTVAGFFYKTWAYRARSADAASSDSKWQLAPLLIGPKPVWRRQQEFATSPWVGVIAGGLFVVALLGVWLALWRYSLGDKRFREQVIAKRLGSDSGSSLNELQLDSQGAPDFSNLPGADSSEPADSDRPQHSDREG
jgi:hypothetical protein